MQQLVIENIRLDPEIGDGIAFTVTIDGVAHRFFVSRQTLGEVAHCLLANNSDLFASFERHSEQVKQAIVNTLKFGTSPNITFLKKAFFN